MKKTILLLLILTLIIGVFTSCQKKHFNIDDEISSSPIEDTNADTVGNTSESNEGSSATEKNNEDRLGEINFYPEGAELGFEAISYFSWNGDGKFNVRHSENLGVQEYIDDHVVSTIDVEFFGRVYTFDYEITANLSTSDQTVHVYKLPGSSITKVMVDAQDGKIIEYVSMPFDNNLITEQQYQNFIQDFIDAFYESKYDISKYEYSCSTYFYHTDENSFSNDSVPYFKTIESNELLGRYTFLYRKFIEGIETNEQIAITFFDDSISFEVLDFGYVEDTFNQVIPTLENLEPYIQEYFKSIIKPEYKISEIAVTKYSLFVKDKTPHVLATVEMKITKLNSTNQWDIDVEEVAQIVCKLVEEE